jgi:excinuclease ABC subunit A
VELSRGEFQRLRLGRQVASKLSGVLYVVDELTAGLHGDEVTAIIALLRGLVEQGNTVLVVEHQPDVVRAADFVVDFGPGPGREGGRIVYEGDVNGLLELDCPTGRWLSGREEMPVAVPRSGSGMASLWGLDFRNLRRRDVSLPIGALGAIVGRSGSGKTAVLEAFRRHLAQRLKLKAGPPPPVTGVEGLDGFGRLVVVDRSPARSPRSNPATYSGMWETVRDLLAATREAQIRGLPARFFSLNVKGGRCEACQGTGCKRVDLDLLPDVYLTCPVCDGRRFNADVLQVTWKGHAADEILALSINEAHALLAGHPNLEVALRSLKDVGLGYVGLGQAAHTLSGGEAHRMRLARELARVARSGIADTVYLIDDPSSGLHPADVADLLILLRKLVADGGTVWMATHHEGLARGADFVLEL